MINLGVKGESISEQDLLTSRSCIIAQSGAGKSYGVAVLCEQLASKGLGFCVIDTEGEYYSLKQEFDVLWVGGKDSDAPILSVDLSELAERVINDGVPVIIDVSEVSDLKGVVDKWLHYLYKAATKHRKPYLLIIEEADKFVPQRGDKLSIISEIARRGRKRGLGLLVASQRPALINKEVLSQCNHQFIGKLTVENDLAAVRHFFNSRKDLLSLPDLMPGEFFMIGFKSQESLFKFSNRLTSHAGFTPELKPQLPDRLSKLINDISSSLTPGGNGVKPLISQRDAELIAQNSCRSKYYFFGEQEVVKSVELLWKPLIELSIKAPNKRLFRNEFINLTAYLTPDLLVVNEHYTPLFDLSFMKGLSSVEVKSLIALLYERARTIKGLVKRTGLSEDESRRVVKSLTNKGLVSQAGWSGALKSFSVVKGIKLPKVISLGSEIIRTKVGVDDSFKPDWGLFKQVINYLNPKASINSSRIIYYPFYQIILNRGDVSRELLINGVTGAS